MDGSNYVMRLNEYAQRNRLKLFYDDVPQSNGTFAMNAVLDNERYPEGLGHTKKEAKQNAAKNALQKLSGEIIQPNDSVASQPERPSVVSNGSIKQANYTCWLNEYGQKQKVKITPKEFSRLTPTGATQCCKFVVGDREFPEAYGKTRKEAKEEAARLVYEELNRTGTTDQERDEASVRQVTNEMDELSLSITEPTTEMNYIGILNEYCQKNNMVHNFKLLDKKGPPNSPQFFYTAIIDKKEYPEGKGNSAKEAKQNAAQQALDSLKNETPSRLRKNPLRLDTGDCSSLGSPALRVPQDSAKEESSGGIVFVNSSGDQSPKMEIIAASTKPKRKLAVHFPHESPDKKQETSSGASAQKSPTQASRFSQDYDTITRIGKGGFGRVYQAWRKLDKKFFAVKIVDSGTKSLREVSALVNLHHRNIVQYYSSWEEDTSSGSNAEKYLYIQMELCKSDLKTWIAEKNGNQSPSRRTEALDIAQQVVNGVEYIHKEGFIHRDLKPANILFDLDGKVKIGDFGLVTFAENAIDGDQLKRTGKRGTKSYMSPEQMESYNYDKKVDIFAVGLIYFELLWPMKTNMEKQTLWQGIRNEKKFPPEFPSKYSAEVNDVSYSLDPEHKLIEKMLDQKPSVRPEASEITSELEVLGTILQGKNDRENRTF